MYSTDTRLSLSTLPSARLKKKYLHINTNLKSMAGRLGLPPIKCIGHSNNTAPNSGLWTLGFKHFVNHDQAEYIWTHHGQAFDLGVTII